MSPRRKIRNRTTTLTTLTRRLRPAAASLAAASALHDPTALMHVRATERTPASRSEGDR